MSQGRSLVPAALVGVVVGALGFGFLRLAALPPRAHVHYHANWALWLNGERVDLSADRYMEDVAACMVGTEVDGRGRVHMHENNPDVVHVHHEGVTWGHLVQNLGWAIGPGWLLTDARQLYAEGDRTRLTFILNGLTVPPAHDRMIRPADRLLISFGEEPLEELVAERFPTVGANAPEYDQSFDPAGCMGQAPETFSERLRRAFWF